MARPHLVFTAWPQLTDTTIPTKLYNPVATHTPYTAATADLRLRPVYGYGQSTVAATLRLRPIYSYGQSTVTANLRLRSIYGCGHSILLLRPLYPLQLQLCYI